MNWKPVPGKPRDMTAEAKGCRFMVHVGHGELWYAMVFGPSGYVDGCGDPWFGPEAQDKARRWCETHARKLKGRA